MHAHPEWASTSDYDQDAGQRTRARMFAELAATPTLVIGTHFAGPTAGRVVRDGEVYRLVVWGDLTSAIDLTRAVSASGARDRSGRRPGR